MAGFQGFCDFLTGLSDTKTGQKRADRIWNCATQLEESGYRTMGWVCKDSMCPRCRSIVSAQIHSKLALYPKVSYMVTCTWRESSRWGCLQSDAKARSNHVKSLARVADVQMLFWTVEFTCSTERIHLHLHTLMTGEEQTKKFVDLFNSVGERFADRKAYDGNAKELAKYLTPSYSQMVGVLTAETRCFRTRGSYGIKADKTVPACAVSVW